MKTSDSSKWRCKVSPVGAQLHRINRWILDRRPMSKWGLVAVMTAAIGYTDFHVGAEISFSIFYCLPVVFAAWFIDDAAGVAVALIAALGWLSIELEVQPETVSPIALLWNAGVRLSFFLIAVVAAALAKRMDAQLRIEVSERTRLLREGAERRRVLERELLEVSSRELVQVSRDLHDGLGQYLAALAMHARVLVDDLRAQQSAAVAQAERVASLIRQTSQITRRIDRALRIPDVGERGITAVLRFLVAEFADMTDVPCHFVGASESPILDEFRTVMVYRIVQEALNNAAKHAIPDAIYVNLSVEQGELTITVIDHGRPAVKVDDSVSGSGAHIMRLRAELIGAKLVSGPRATGAYTVTCRLPIGSDGEREIEEALT